MATIAKLNLKQADQKEVGLSLTKLAIRRLSRDRLTLLAMGTVIFLTLASFIGGPLYTELAGVSFSGTSPRNTFQPFFSEGHVLGTDDLGRDHLARLLYAGQVSLSVAFIAATLSLTIGVSSASSPVSSVGSWMTSLTG